MVILVNNMKKIFLILLFSFLFFNKVYSAEATGQPTKYEVTMKKVELCENATCSGTPFVLGTRSMPADIASASAGADVGSYAPTTGIPVGVTYTHLRVTLDRTFNITADISVGAGTCTTDGGDNASATQMTVGTADGTAVSEAMYLVNAGSYGGGDGTRDGDVGSSDLDISYDSPSSAISMSVSGDDAVMIYALTNSYRKTLRAPVIRIKFDTSTAVGVEDTACTMWINEPSVSISLN